MGSDLLIKFIGVDLVSGVAARAGMAVERFATRTREANMLAAASWMRAGTAATMTGAMIGAAGGGIALGLEHAARAAANFESDIVLLHTHAGVVPERLSAIRQGLLDMAPAVGIGPDELAKSMFPGCF